MHARLSRHRLVLVVALVVWCSPGAALEARQADFIRGDANGSARLEDIDEPFLRALAVAGRGAYERIAYR